jgi:eukaryotic-like serine/threonine-protein kinase
VSDPARVKDLFDVARDLPAAERARYLTRECADDARMRRRVEALLAADAAAGRFLAAPTAGAGLRVEDNSEYVRLQHALAGRYSIEREIGRGGMGVVYLARDIALDRQVAVKQLPPDLTTSAEHRARFLREVRTAAGLSHPNVVPIHLVEEQADVVCFVMSFVEGETLREWVTRSGPLSAGDSARVMQEVAWALAHAHERGIVHRDVKPDNILIERGSQRALVTDFGIAGTLDAGATVEGFFLGTPLFASPEQAAGRPMDARSDLYSLGATIFFALTGRPLFDDTTAQAVLARHISEPAPSIGALRQDLPRALVEAVDRSLAKDPQLRLASAEELAKALGAAVGVGDPLPEPIRRVVRETNQLTVDVVGWGLCIIAAGLGWVLAKLTSGGFLMDLITGVFQILALVGSAVIAVRMGEALSEVREALRKGFPVAHLTKAIHDAVVAPARREVNGSRTALIVGAAVGLTVACWLNWYGPFGYPARWLKWPINAMGLLGPLAIGRLVTRKALSGSSPGFAWLRRVNSVLGNLVLRTAAFRRPTPSTQDIAQPTEALLASGVTSLLERLPAVYRESLQHVPALVTRLEGHSEALRERRAELEGLIAEAGATEPGEDTVPVDDGTASKLRARSRVAKAALVVAHENVGARLRDVIAALDVVRLGLLRLHAGAGSPADLTEDLELALEVGAQVEALLQARSEADEIARDGVGIASRAHPELRMRRFTAGGTMPLAAAILVGGALLMGMPLKGNGPPITIDTTWTAFDTRGLFAGTLDLDQDSLIVVFDSTLIERGPFAAGPSSKQLDSLTLSVITGTCCRSETDWVTVRTSVAALVDDSLGDRSRFSLGPVRFAVSRPPLDTLRRSWLRIAFYQNDTARSPPVSTSYANSLLFIFSSAR